MPDDWRGFGEEEVAWFKARPCEEMKVCAGGGRDGGLVIWDSRTVHFSVLPGGRNGMGLMRRKMFVIRLL